MRRFVSEGIILKSVGYKNILGKMQGPGTTTGLVDKQRKSRENAEKPRQHRPLYRNCAGHSRIEAIYDDLTPFHPFYLPEELLAGKDRSHGIDKTNKGQLLESENKVAIISDGQ